MLRRILILDGALVALLVFGGVKLHQEWNAFGPLHDVAAIQARPQVFPSLAVSASAAPSAGPADWTEIPTRNPFSFDRSDIDIVVAEAPVRAVGPKPVLFGAIFLDKDNRVALVAPGPAGKNYRPMKLGDTIDGWTIVELSPKSMVVESNGLRESVIMNDPTLQIPREAVRTAATSTSSTITPPAQQRPPTPTPSTPTAPGQPTAAPPLPPLPPREPGRTMDAFDLFGAPRQRQ